jgi:amino acid permease
MSDSFSSPNKEKAFEVDIASAERASSNGSYTPPPDSRLHRELKNRHVAMIRYLLTFLIVKTESHYFFSALVV